MKFSVVTNRLLKSVEERMVGTPFPQGIFRTVGKGTGRKLGILKFPQI